MATETQPDTPEETSSRYVIDFDELDDMELTPEEKAQVAECIGYLLMSDGGEPPLLVLFDSSTGEPASRELDARQIAGLRAMLTTAEKALQSDTLAPVSADAATAPAVEPAQAEKPLPAV